MKNLDIKNYLYHGIVDWKKQSEGKPREKFCLDKLGSILQHRYIYRPCDFKKYGITHRDYANHYTYHVTFTACHPESIYATRFKKDIKEDNGYKVATEYSIFGILLDSSLLDELPICEDSFCDNEIVIASSIPVDRYGRGIYINPRTISSESYQIIRKLIDENNYDFGVFNVLDGAEVESLEQEKSKVYKL